jgi:GNAT superfamily N-acetyltransferase
MAGHQHCLYDERWTLASSPSAQQSAVSAKPLEGILVVCGRRLASRRAVLERHGQNGAMSDVASPFTVRKADLSDLGAVLRVLALGGSDGLTPQLPSELELRTWDQMMHSVELGVYLGESDGEAIGTAAMMTMPHLTYKCAPTAFIEAVVVVPSHRRKGVATQLMERVLNDARSAGCNKVQLLSHKRHAADGAHRLYQNLGFEAEAEGFRLYLEEVPRVVLAARDR